MRPTPSSCSHRRYTHTAVDIFYVWVFKLFDRSYVNNKQIGGIVTIVCLVVWSVANEKHLEVKLYAI